MKASNRKKWTPKTEVTDALLKFREKRKWQIALRRYILEQKWSASYAPYFGLDILHFRRWIEIQFDEVMSWDNFSETWQLDHVIPVIYFDFASEADRRLCWSFINIRVEKLEQGNDRGNRPDILSAKSYFETLYLRTVNPLCKEMVRKIQEIESHQLENTGKLEAFLLENEQYIKTIASFSDYEYLQLNEGIDIGGILEERAFSEKIDSQKDDENL
jgi:hypothetical protein